jgi:NAD(P)-dependent dehydrogenase (short-subunit alcohol dehydrogenase family)
MSWTLVTGGAQGLGAEVCTSLAKAGYNVLIHYNVSEKKASDLVEKCINLGVKAASIHGDLTTPSSVDALISTT